MTLLLQATAVGAILVAGIFYAFSTFVMAALARLDAGEGIRAMQAINVVVINPWAMAAMFGPALAGIAIVAMSLASGQRQPLSIAGALLYVIGCIGVTVACNVPLNDRLAAVASDAAAGHELWSHYLKRWTMWNSVRTAAALAGGALMLAAAQRP